MSLHRRMDGVPFYTEFFMLPEGCEELSTEFSTVWQFEYFTGSAQVFRSEDAYSLLLTFPSGGEDRAEEIVEDFLERFFNGEFHE